MVKDIEEMCISRSICQKAGPAIMIKAPLTYLNCYERPFKRMTTDVVGLLSCTKSENELVLVMMDYATKWPEVFTLRNVNAEAVVDCLV